MKILLLETTSTHQLLSTYSFTFYWAFLLIQAICRRMSDKNSFLCRLGKNSHLLLFFFDGITVMSKLDTGRITCSINSPAFLTSLERPESISEKLHREMDTVPCLLLFTCDFTYWRN